MFTKLRMRVISATSVVVIISATAIMFVCHRSKLAAETCIKNLWSIDGAKHQWALEGDQSENSTPTWEDIQPWLPWVYGKGRVLPECPRGGTYTIGIVRKPAQCSIPGHDAMLGSTWNTNEFPRSKF